MTEVAAAFILRQDDDGKKRFLICRRPPEKARGLMWEFVGGKLEKGETAAEALIRECREELDVAVEPGMEYMRVTHEYPDITIRLIVLQAVIKEGTPRMLEHVDMQWITAEEISGYDFCPADRDILEKIQNDFLYERRMDMSVLSECRPKKVFEFFELISSVPHGSGNTKEVSDICVQFARERGLDYYQDHNNNVVIRKTATPGYENAPTVILQGHLDMVCAKKPDDPMDMSKEVIRLCTDGEWVWADGTSLGGDDGIAVACAMAVLDDNTLPHPALEAVFTVDEETSMLGAQSIDPEAIKGRLMLNLDSEEEGVFTVSCAGGVHVSCEMPARRAPIPAGYCGVRIVISGLLGGHSGCEIHKERGSSHQLMGRFLYEMSRDMDIRLLEFTGGQFDNVIPLKTEAVAAIPSERFDEFTAAAEKYDRIYKNELSASDPGVRIDTEKAELTAEAVAAEDSVQLLKALYVLPFGMQNICVDIPDLAQTSLNIGKIRLESDAFRFVTFVRSSIDSQKNFVAKKVKTIIEILGGTCTIGSSYPGWLFRRDSPMLALAKEVFAGLNGTEPKVTATHGGLECGLLIEKLPGLDCLSLGPDLRDIHSVRERLNVGSVERMYAFVCEFLRRSR